MKKLMGIILVIAAVFIFVACSKKPSDNMPIEVKPKENDKEEPFTAEIKAEYHKITPEQAKKRLDEDAAVILLDVRTQEEYDANHIEGALLIPDYELEDRAKGELADKNATILVYCRSGIRSAVSAKALVAMGYTGVYDFGGIIDYPYATVVKE